MPAAFATVAAPWMPSAPSGGTLTSTWFCPGVPAGGEEGTGGEIVVANAGATPMQARVTLLAGPDQSVVQSVTVPPYERATVDPSASVTTPYASATVEIDGGGGLVEQRATQPAGTSVAPCANQAASSWYLAEGFTSDNSNEQLVLTNPYDGWASVDIGFATADGSRQPLEGEPVPPRSVKIIDMDSLAARDEAEVAVTVDVSRGSLIVGRAQVYDGDGRLGYSMTLASPALRSQWWFANGEKGPGVTERFSVYNPTDDDVEVTPLFLGTQGTDVLTEPIQVPARQVVTYDAGTVQGLPDGRHAVVFATTDESQSIVVERAITRTIDGIPTTSVLPGRRVPPVRRLRVEHLDAGRRPGRGRPRTRSSSTTSRPPTPSSRSRPSTAEGVVTVPSLAEIPLAGRRPDHDPADRPGGHRRPARRALDVAGVRRALAARGSRRRRAAVRRGPSRWWAEPWSGVLVAAAIVVVAVAVAVVARRRRPDPPTQPAGAVPAQLDRPDFARPDADWLVAVFTSATCQTCADVARKADVLASDDVAVTEVEYQAHKDVHARYAIDAVPLLVIADRAGVVRRSFVGPVSATDLWAAVAAARDEDQPSAYLRRARRRRPWRARGSRWGGAVGRRRRDAFVEWPRWRDGRLWVSDFYTHRVIAVTLGDELRGARRRCPASRRGSGGCRTGGCSWCR